jgi:hypothetical protein
MGELQEPSHVRISAIAHKRLNEAPYGNLRIVSMSNHYIVVDKLREPIERCPG